jgi:hypothetical protein
MARRAAGLVVYRLLQGSGRPEFLLLQALYSL